MRLLRFPPQLRPAELAASQVPRGVSGVWLGGRGGGNMGLFWGDWLCLGWAGVGNEEEFGAGRVLAG